MDTTLGSALAAARRWCELVEAPAGAGAGAELVAILTSALAELLATTLAIPAVEPTSSDLDRWRPDDAEVRSRFADVQLRLGKNDS